MAIPLVLAHRGASARAPENTVEAFALARELGADGVELDVRRCADGVLVVHHDPGIEGFGLLVDAPFEAVRASAPSVPTLGEAFDALNGLVVNVEIKCLPHEPDADPRHEAARAVVDEIDARGIGERVIVSSFWLDHLDVVRAAASTLPTAWLTFGQPLADAAATAAAHGHAWLNPDKGAALTGDPAEGVRAAHEAGVRVSVWTVDDAVEIATLRDAGADAIITNVPDVARDALRAPRG